MTFNHRRLAYLAALQWALGLFDGLAARAGIIFLLGLAASLCLWRRSLIVGYVVLSIGYAVPILLLASDSNFRYLFPVTITGMAILAAACCVLVRKILTGGPARRLARELRDAVTAAPSGRVGLPRPIRSRRDDQD